MRQGSLSKKDGALPTKGINLPPRVPARQHPSLAVRRRAKSASRQFRNPILSGSHPAPTVCRVDGDFYLATAALGYFPGFPVFQSRDLVNWRQIGDVPLRSSSPRLAATLLDSRDVPTLRHDRGLFYLISADPSGSGSLVRTAADAAGQWSEPSRIVDARYGASSLLFEDNGGSWWTGYEETSGKHSGNRPAIWLQAFDRAGMRLVGERHHLVKAESGPALDEVPDGIAPPRLYRVNGWYILLTTESGGAAVYRSRQIAGPYERDSRNPILADRDPASSYAKLVTCDGHGDLVDTPVGEWWMVLQGCRLCSPYDADGTLLGRETFLVPVGWQDGWPTIAKGYLDHPCPVPNLPECPYPDASGHGSFVWTDHFDGPGLERRWSFPGLTQDTPLAHDLISRPGWLRIRVRPQWLTDRMTTVAVGVQQRHTTFFATVTLEFVPQTAMESAGFALIKSPDAFFAIEVGRASVSEQRVVRLLRCRSSTIDRPTGNETTETLSEIAITTTRVRLMIEVQGNTCAFYYAEDESPEHWQCLAGTQDASFLWSRFAGVYLGLYATSRGTASTHFADFDDFEYRGDETDISLLTSQQERSARFRL